MAILAGARVNQIVASNRFNVGIGKKGERVTLLLRKVSRNFGTIDADRNGTNSNFFELVQASFNAP